MKALAIACVIREIGANIAGVFHTSTSGDDFRGEPFEYLKQSGFLGGIDPFFVLQRPLFNQVSPTFPNWGGLTRAELEGIPLDKLSNAIPNSGDSDVDGWVGGILSLVEEVKLSELDLITIYE